MKKIPPTRIGFTLIETILYTGLFSALFTGIIVSAYPLFTGAERLTASLLQESDINFILTKIEHSLAQSLTSAEGEVLSPVEGASDNTLVLGSNTSILYTFEMSTSSALCTPPRLCSFLTMKVGSAPALPLNNERLLVENLNVTHTAPNPTTKSSRLLEISFTANGQLVGPIRYYLRF